MPYLPNTPADRQAMLQAIGIASLDELFDMVPPDLRLGRDLAIPPAMSEIELTGHIRDVSRRNRSADDTVCFLGGGSYDHFIPAVVDAIASRGEFYTSYTPYQPEVSQGNLQAFFEYQTLITQLTGMDVSNASLYDGASAMAEAALMCLARSGRDRIVVPASVHPEYRENLGTYLQHIDAEVVTVATPGGTLQPGDLADHIDNRTACVIVQHPNFFGCLENADALARATHNAGALFVVVFDPISLGILKRPGDYGADIAVAEGQSLGSPMAYGGPYLGIMACREDFVRRMPGRIVGETADRNGKRCFVLTLQTREQHIRREKATSNICTNQGLFALRAAVYLALMGPQGMRAVAELCVRKAHYAADRLAATSRLSLAFDRPLLKEFVVRDRQNNVAQLLDDAEQAGFFAGVPLGRWYEQWDDCLLVTVTEKRTREEIDRLTATVG